ncbi:MAG: T9SS type A sorting domain-containing protein [Bacteroidota bacterium]
MTNLLYYVSCLLALAVISVGQLFAQPANDSICNAIFLPLSDTCMNMGSANGDNTGAAQENGEPIASCFAGGTNSVWFKTVAPASGFVSLSTDYILTAASPNTDTEIALYALPAGDCSNFSDLMEIACSQDEAGNLQFNSTIPFAPVVPGDTVYVSVSGWNGTQGSFCLDVSEFIPPPGPSNDTLCNAVLLTVGDTCTGPNGDTQNALLEPGEPSSWCTSAQNSVWYTFVAPASGYVNITTDVPFMGTNFETDLILYANPGGNCMNLADLFEISCSSDEDTGIGFGANLDSIPLTPGDTFFVAVVDGGGTFCIEVEEVTPSYVPANDDVCNAISLTVGDTCLSPIGNNLNAGIQIGEPVGSCFFGNTTSLWYSFVGPASGLITISTDILVQGVENDDTEIALYELGGGNCANLGDLIEVACDQDAGQVVGSNGILQTVQVTSGTTYYIQVSGASYSQGAFCMELSAAPANDSVCQAIDIPVDGMVRSYTNFGASSHPLEDSLIAPPAGDGFSNVAWSENVIHNSVWFSFSAPTSGGVFIDLCNNEMGTEFDTQVAVYEVGQCDDFGTFTFRGANDNMPGSACDFASQLEVFCLTPGQTYYILVDGWQGEMGGFGISVSDAVADPLSLQLTSTNPLCPDEATGAIDLQVSGGGFPYTYQWNSGSMMQDLNDLVPGTYIVTVTDACDSTLMDSAQIDSASPLVLDVGMDQSFCKGHPFRLGGNPTGSGGSPLESQRAYVVSNQPQDELIAFGVKEVANDSVIGGGSLASVTAGDFAEGVLYGIDDVNEELVSIDLSTGQTIILGNPVLPGASYSWNGLAYIKQTATMYAAASDGFSSTLYSIDLATGEEVEIGSMGLSSIGWLAADTSGQLYTVDVTTGILYTINPQNAAPLIVGPVDLPGSGRQGADFDPDNNVLYVVSTDANQSAATFRRVNIATGVSTVVDTLAFSQIDVLAIAPESRPPYIFSWTPTMDVDDSTLANPVTTATITTTYTVVMMDGCGKSLSDSVVINRVDGPVLALSSSPAAVGMPGSATAFASGGTAPYSYLWSTGDTTFNISAYGGTYLLTITDALGCTVTDSVTIGGPTVSIDELTAAGFGQLSLYPNPSHGSVSLDGLMLKPGRLHIHVFDVQGRAVYQTELQVAGIFETTLNLEQSPAGVYLVHLRSNHGQITRRLLIE